MRRFKNYLAYVILYSLLLSLILPGFAAGNPQYDQVKQANDMLLTDTNDTPISVTSVPPGNEIKYDVEKQAKAMLQRHDIAPKLDSKSLKQLKSMQDEDFIPVIIHLKEKVNLKNIKSNINKNNFSADAVKQHKKAVINELKETAMNTQGVILTALEKQKSKGKAKDIKSFWIFNGITAKITKDVIYQLADNPEVERIVLDDIKFTTKAETTPGQGDDITATISNQDMSVSEQTYNPLVPVSDQDMSVSEQTYTNSDITWGIEKIGANLVWDEYGINGEGIVIGSLDTGVDPRHPDLLINPGGDPEDPDNWKLIGWAEFDGDGNMINNDRQNAYDDYGHGTHTSGTSLGGAHSGTSIGVAPGARLVAGKVLDYGYGTFDQVVAGMEWIASVPEVRVVNMSLGATGTYSEMIEPTRNMVEMMVFPSFSIGNSGQGSSGSPGNVPAAFGVGATDINDDIAYFSSGEMVEWADYPYYGSYLKPDVAAPGVYVYSSLPGGSYEYWDGTSMAAPHVTGSVGLILQSNPWLSVDEIKALLKETAVDLGSAGPDTNYGWGSIDVKAAIDKLQNVGFVNGLVTGPDGEAVEADIEVDGTLLGNTDPVFGTYDIPLTPGNHTITVTSAKYKTGTASVDIVKDQYAECNFNLVPKELGSFAGIVKNSSGKPLANTVVEVEGLSGAVAITDKKGSYRIDNILEGNYTLRVTPPMPYGLQRISATIPSSGGLVMNDVTVVKADVLLIEHDYYNDYEYYYIEALAQKGYSVAYWDWDAAFYVPSLDILKQFNKLILADDNGNVIYVDENTDRALRGYLDSGRKMFVSGQDIGWNIDAYPEFYSNYLHAKYLADTGSWLVRGVASGSWPLGIYEGLDMDIDFGGDDANNQIWPDVVVPNDNQAVSVADYVDPYVAGSGALAVDGPLHRLMYFSFGFEGIKGADQRADVMDRTMKYLDSPTENTSSAIQYTTAWNTVSDSNASDGRYRVSDTTNATSTYQFTGDSVAWVTAKGPSYGEAEVFIDELSKGVVDLYNSTQSWNQRLDYTGLGSGNHIITIKVLGQKNASSTGESVVVDSFTSINDDRDSAVVYSGAWSQESNSNAYNDTVSYSEQKGASATFTFTGKEVTLFVGKGPDHGIAQIYLDGVNKGTLDLYASSDSYNVPIKTFTGLPSATHTLKIVVTGTKNPSAAGVRIMTDAFSVYTEDNSQNITYTSAWTLAESSSASGGSFHYCDVTNSKAIYKFAGNSITLLISKGPNSGIGRIYIDGVDKGTVDFYAPSNLDKIPVTFNKLSFGEHTIELVNTGTKHSASSGTRIVLDAINRGLND